MTKNGDQTAIAGGLNTAVEYADREYQVQTQSSMRDAPIIESMVFHGGQTLVRITASYEEVANTLGFTGADAQHLVELQHANLIRKIRHGMLADDESDGPPRLVDAEGVAVDPSEIDDPGVQELLRELGAGVAEARTEKPPRRRSRRPRWVLCIRLPF